MILFRIPIIIVAISALPIHTILGKIIIHAREADGI